MNVSVASVPASGSRVLARTGWGLMLICALLAAGNALMFMFIEPHGHPGIKARFFGSEVAGWAHTMGGAIAVLIGPFQFLSGLRARLPAVHVWMGRTYLLAVLAAALGGLYFAPTSVGDVPGTVGFSVLAVLWLYTGSMAFAAIRRRDVATHRRWMIRNYALTFAAATLRIELGMLQFGGLTFDVAFPIVAWSSWTLNALAVELWLRRR
jgi:uncharacterized membrane protein